MKKLLIVILFLLATIYYPLSTAVYAACSNTTLPAVTSVTQSAKCDVEDMSEVSMKVIVTGTSATVEILCQLTDADAPTKLTHTDLPLTSTKLVGGIAAYACKFVQFDVTACTSCSVTAICKRCGR